MLLVFMSLSSSLSIIVNVALTLISAFSRFTAFAAASRHERPEPEVNQKFMLKDPHLIMWPGPG
jgi:hypothetical protein